MLSQVAKMVNGHRAASGTLRRRSLLDQYDDAKLEAAAMHTLFMSAPASAEPFVAFRAPACCARAWRNPAAAAGLHRTMDKAISGTAWGGSEGPAGVVAVLAIPQIKEILAWFGKPRMP
jgi:hypothetical protein